MSKRMITPEQAINLLNDGDTIHTFNNPSGMLIGADHDRSRVIEKINRNSANLEIGGDACRRMKHGLVINDGSLLFIETNEEKLNQFDLLKVKNRFQETVFWCDPEAKTPINPWGIISGTYGDFVSMFSDSSNLDECEVAMRKDESGTYAYTRHLMEDIMIDITVSPYYNEA